MPRPSTTISCLLALASAVSAQTTHLVGPGGFAQIRDALAIAAPGDVLDVQPGTYAHFSATVGVTIRAQVPGTVLVEFDPSLTSPGCASNPACALAEGPTRLAPPAGQVVHCIGLEFRPTVAGWARHRVVVGSGTATFDQCTLRTSELDALRVENARVHLQSCTVGSFGTGSGGCAISATSAALTAVDCAFTGAASASIPGPAVRLRTAQLQGNRVTLTGGAQLFGGPAAAALDLDATSAAWLGDAHLLSSNTGCAIVGGGGGWLARTTISPGLPTCGSLPFGTLVGIDSGTPLLAGAPFAVAFRGAPNQIVAVFASAGLGHLPLPGLTDQPLTLDLGSTWLAAAVLTDALGNAAVQWTLPAGAGGLPLFVLGAALQPNTLGLSPPLGGVVR
ncbi:MAG: hypothetical protein JNK15_17705 [Planctomycetes bacterium]|nr:hypothetical protein [Planctomycetota bacterium]